MTELDWDEIILPRLIDRFAARTPEAICASFADTAAWTWRQAQQEMNRAAACLQARGLRRGERVLVAQRNGPDWLRAWWGITAAGGVIAPINPTLKGDLLRHCCETADPSIVVADQPAARQIAELGLAATILSPADLVEGPDSPEPVTPALAPWDTHAIVFTSGTTGPSKGVVITYLHSYRSGVDCDWDPGPADVFLAWSPLFHVSAQANAYGIWVGGGTLAVRDGIHRRDFLAVVRAAGATMTNLVGGIGNVLASTPEQPGDHENPLRVVKTSPMVADPEGFMRRFGIAELVVAFGMTEIGTVMSYRSSSFPNPDTCGRARHGAELRLVDDNDMQVAEGEVGELILRCDQPWEITPAYFGQPEATARAWRNGWFHTGDLMRRDAEGHYYFADRAKDALRRRGENISSFEVEREVATHPGVQEVACVGVAGEFGDDEVKVWVVPRPGAVIDPAELVQYLERRMAPFMVPRYVEVVDSLLKTPSMRVYKQALRALGNSEATWDRDAARTERRT